MKRFILACLVFVITCMIMHAQTLVGTNPKTQIEVYEFYNHNNNQEWLKVCRIDNDGWNRGGVSGLLFFNNYHGEGSGFIEYSFPQSITSNQEPVLVLHGNAANDFNWYAYQNVDENGKNGYDIFIKTPAYHVGFTFLMRGYSYKGYCTIEDSPTGTIAWNSIDNQDALIYYKGNGYVGLGTLTPDYKLDVIGTVRAQEIKVDLEGADFVFEEDYNLMPLNQLEKFVTENKHLPEIDPAKEMEKNGTNLGDLNSKLLQKIEELTLYTIDQNKAIKELMKVVEIQNSKIEKLESLTK